MNSALKVKDDHQHAFNVWSYFLAFVVEKTVSFVSFVSGALFLDMKQNLIQIHFYALS